LDRATYDEITYWYDEAIRSGTFAEFHEFVISSLLDLVGDLRGLRVLDLACGQGVVARRLAERGATVVGVDISAAMLDLARYYERSELRGITYRQEDAGSLAGLADESFDGVVCNMALMDIADLPACLDSVARVLRPGGSFVFSIVPPFFQTPGSPRWVRENGKIVGLEVRNYFTEGYWRRDNPEGVRGKVGAYHRTLSTYVNELVRAGLAIERFVEPPATGRLAEIAPVYKEVPAALLARCAKPGDGRTHA
jgi:ubiquinone/menaquinone biosynthesis C-methylase UbiE